MYPTCLNPSAVVTLAPLHTRRVEQGFSRDPSARLDRDGTRAIAR
jgi:hypothetical protein